MDERLLTSIVILFMLVLAALFLLIRLLQKAGKRQSRVIGRDGKI